METRPSGTVTFLFTDIEGSTKLAQEHPDKWESLRERHPEEMKAESNQCKRCNDVTKALSYQHKYDKMVVCQLIYIH